MAKKRWCKLFGCDIRFNFASLPSKCICRRCKTKWMWNLDPYSDWIEVDKFSTTIDLGTDQEMIDRWIRRG
jgi:hypothetical protein